MNHIKAIFKKQVKDTLKNPTTLLQFIIFPGVAWAMNLVLKRTDMPPEMIAEMPNMVLMMASIFAGMGLIPVVTGMIAEDRERKSLRFLTMAGIKSSSYLLGIGLVVFIISGVTSLAFAFLTDFTGTDFWIFLASMLSAVVGSILLGALFGIISNNPQAGSALAVPVALILGFGPMMAQFNSTVARFLKFFYTQQLNTITDVLLGYDGLSADLLQSFGIMWANVAVLAVLFALIYKRKGVRT